MAIFFKNENDRNKFFNSNLLNYPYHKNMNYLLSSQNVLFPSFIIRIFWFFYIFTIKIPLLRI